jgi:hypothetical protein
MGTKELREAYGGNPKMAMNRAIRAMPGGTEALSSLERWHGICRSRGWDDVNGHTPYHVQAYEDILAIVDAMEDAVRVKYTMAPRVEREDLRRGQT